VVFATYILCTSHGAYIHQFDFIDESLSLIDVQIDLDEGTKILRPQLDLAMRSCSAGMTSSWRNNAFHPPSDGGEFGAGVLNMSPGWFQQLQDVSLFYINSLFVVLAYFIC
jgi:hypothetical protein